jgi:WD40 repeat protein
MELELTKPLLPGLNKKTSIQSALTKNPDSKTDFEDLHEYFQGLPPSPNILRGHTEFLNCVRISPNGKLIATAAGDSKVILWDLQEKTQLKEFLGHSGWVRCAMFTPDSKFLISADTKGNIFMWNIETLEKEAQFEGLEDVVYTIDVSADGKYLAAGGQDNLIKVWNLEDRTEKYTLNPDVQGVKSLVISKDSKYIISGSYDSSVKIWDLEEGKELYEYDHEGGVYIVVISDDNKYVASGGYGYDLKIWNLEKNQLEATIENHDGIIYGLAISSDSKYVASGSVDKTVRLWNIAQAREEAVFKGHSSTINSLVFTTDGKYLASGSKDNTVRLWNLKEMKLEIELTGHFWEIIDLVISPDNKYLISASWDKTARIWDLETTKEYAVIDSTSNSVIELSISGDGKFISSVSKDGILAIWGLEDFSEKFRSEQKATCSAFTSDSRYFAGGSADYKISLLEIATDQHYELGSHTDYVSCLIFSSDDKYLISGSFDSMVKIFNVETRLQESVLIGHSSYIRCLAISQDSKYLISGSEDNTVRVWDFETKTEEYVIEGQFDPIYSAAISSDNKFITYGCRDTKVRVWNNYDMKNEVVLEGHTEAVKSMAITCDDKFLISASGDSTRIWNLREMKQEKLLSTNRCDVNALEITKDCKFLISGNDDGKIRIWDLTDCIAEYGLVSEFEYEIKGYDYTFEKEVLIDAFKREKNVKHKPYMDKLLIMPNKVNPLHLYAYYNDTTLMAEALKSGCNFINTRYGESPITICLRRNSRKCLDLLLEYIINLGATNEAKQSFIIDSIFNDIPDLIKTNSKYLVDFLSILTKKSDSIFIKPISKLPIRSSKNICILDASSFNQDFNVEGGEELVEIMSTRFKWNIYGGSNESIQLLESILESPVEEIYRTDLVKSIIDYKWDELYTINLTFTFLYLLNLVCLIAVIFYGNSKPLVNNLCSCALILINIFLFLYEIYQSITTGASYFFDLWNYVDIVRSPICITWGFLSIAQSSGYEYDELTFLANLLCWIRGLTYFRTFKPTRIFVRMVIGVFKDTASFLIVLTYTTLAYGTLFVASSNSKNHDLIEVLKKAYLFDLSNFETDDITASQWVVFFIASIMNCIIMLNLLISILGDSYGKIQETMIESDYSQMLDVILELEKLMIWNRQKGAHIYLQVCREFEDGDDGKELESQVKDLNKKLEDLSQKFELKSQETESILKEIYEKVSKIAASS